MDAAKVTIRRFAFGVAEHPSQGRCDGHNGRRIAVAGAVQSCRWRSGVPDMVRGAVSYLPIARVSRLMRVSHIWGTSVIIITGATGNTGSRVARRLVESQPGERVVALVRPESDTRVIETLGIRVHRCDLQAPETYLPVVEAGAVFVETANLRFARAMAPPLVDAGVARAYCVTTTAVYSRFHSYASMYRDIERELTALPVPVTLLRPSMIYGNVQDHNMHKLIDVMRRSPLFPVFGPGVALMQPVFVDDLAAGIAGAVERGAVGTYDLAGPEPLSYNDVLMTVAEILGRKIRLIHINHNIAAAVVGMLQHVPGFPVTHEQVMRLLEDKAFDISASRTALGFAPRSFRDGITLEIEGLGSGR